MAKRVVNAKEVVADIRAGRQAIPLVNQPATPTQTVRRVARQRETSWYDNALFVVLLMVGLFPLGFFALYRNSTLALEAKAVIAMAWLLLPSALLIMISGATGWNSSAVP
jgi:hypothetical protein